ncbi:MAG TPA: lysophospholipid acyltransferase family protein [Candidatus Avimonas sp.]|nr:1-acyl-sn-glycerol-3-phosphate acyltransferase [Clostridiales bacterium]HPU58411.1 lysophospholipid acyltransferase family protein [Candidatus Avimonas sp.]
MKFGRFLLWLIRPLFYLLFPYKVKGMENVPKGQGHLMLCCNHISNLDPVFLLLAFKQRPIHFMAKAELFKNRFTAWLFSKVFGAFPVNRGKGDTESLKTAERLVNEGKLMGIFPEGTRSKDGKLGRGKSGAALIASRTGASVLPVAIKTKNQKIKLFRKTNIYIGRVLTPEELRLTGDNPDIKYASRVIMERIAGLMEENS